MSKTYATLYNDEIKTIDFNITKSEGWYSASGINAPIITQGKTFEDLEKNIEEAVSLYLEDEDVKKEWLDTKPKISLKFNFSPKYA
ncbi:MAG: hypothetical protein WCP15_00175 [bacterium]